MYEVAKVAGYLLSPLTLVMIMWLAAGWCLAAGRRRLALSLAVLAFTGLWAASMPVVAQALNSPLERRYPAVTVEATPTADAIVILGGAVVGRHPPQRPFLGLHSASSRVWHAAELFRAGKARWVVIAAGGRPDSADEQIEADAIAEMLVRLGVPAEAIHRETQSRNTAENAANIRPMLERLGAHKVLLVTSAQHMYRALATFRKVWGHSAIALIAIPTDFYDPRPLNSLNVWIPSPNTLLYVTKGIREYAGLVRLAMM